MSAIIESLTSRTHPTPEGATEPVTGLEALRPGVAGQRVIRGGAVRTLGYAAGVILAVPISVLVLRHLGVVDYGRYATVVALMGMVAGLSDLGLTAVGVRDLTLRGTARERRELLSTLLGVRIAVASLGVAVAALFALGVGYDLEMVIGVLVAGVGIVFLSGQAIMSLPLWVSLRVGTLTGLDVLRPVLMLAGTATVVALEGSLVALLAVGGVVGGVLVVLTVFAVGRRDIVRPSLDFTRARTLVRRALPVTVASTLGVMYFGSLVVVVSLVGNEVDTGLFGTSFRIFEMLVALPVLVVSITLPVLSVAARDSDERLRFGLQRTAEGGFALGVFLVLIVEIVADPVIRLIGGDQYAGAADVLRIQVLALPAIFLAQTFGMALLVLRLERLLVIGGLIGFLLVIGLGIALVPIWGAEGAAVAGVLADVAASTLAYLFVSKAHPAAKTDLAFLWRGPLAAGIAATALLVPGLPAFLVAAIAAIAYVILAVVLRAVPPDVVEILASTLHLTRRDGPRRSRS